MQFTQTKLKDVWLIQPQVYNDKRGFFMESYSKKDFTEHGINTEFIQDNHSKSTEKYTLRGLHFQRPPYAQTKLTRVIRGAVIDVVVDIRKGSPSYGQWQSFELSEKNQLLLYIPRGFAHGFCTIKENTEFIYKVDNYYAPEYDSGIIWNDSDLNIDWPTNNPLLSEKDRMLPSYKSINSPFNYKE